MVKIKMAESNFPNVNGPTVITKKIGSKEYFFIVRTHQGKEEYLSIGMDHQPKWVTNFNFASTYPDAGAAQEAYDMMMKNYHESASYRYWHDVFEKKIPQCMRYKEFSIEGDILYWITQDEFDEFDLSHFIDALEDSPLKKAFVILRDDSTYNFRKDLRNGKGTMIDLTQNNYIIRNYRESLNKKTEAIFDIKQLYKLGASDGDMYDDTGKTLCIKHRKNVRQIIDYLESCGLKQVWDCFSAWEVKKKTNGKPGYCVMPVENDDDFYGFDVRLFIYHPVLESVEPDNSIEIKEDLMIPGTNIMLEAGDKIRISGVSKKNEEWSSDQLTAWASKQDEVIFKEGDFTLIKRYGVGIKNTPYSTYSVLVSGQAEECVIDFYLESRFQNFNGELVEDTPKKITLKWGFSSHMVSSSLMIKKLTEAYKFADKVSKYFKIEFTNK